MNRSRRNPESVHPIYRALLSATRSEGRAWVQRNEDEIYNVIARGLSRAARKRIGPARFLSETLPVEQAVQQLREWMGHLAQITYRHPKTGAMLKDEIGFNAADDTLFREYLAAAEPPPEDHLRAANALVKYGQTQLGGRENILRFVERVREWATAERQRIDAETAEKRRKMAEAAPRWQRGEDAGATEGNERMGTVAGAVPYLWDQENLRILFFPQANSEKWAARVLGPTATSGRVLDENGEWRWASILFTAPDQLNEARDHARANRYNQFADLIERYFDTWAAASRLEQSRDEGRTQGGFWKVKKYQERKRDRKTGLVVPVEKEEIHVWLDARIPRDVFYNIKKWSENDGFHRPGYRYVLTDRTVTKFVDEIRASLPRFAEALARAFGGIATVMDEERGFCRPLENMSLAVRPEDVIDPVALEALADVKRAFAERGPKRLTPLDFQWVGIAYAKTSNYRCLIADSPGLGKTIQGIGCVIADPEENLPALVVAPANVVYNWSKEILKWTKQMGPLPVTVLIGSRTASEVREADASEDGESNEPRSSKRKNPEPSDSEVLVGAPIPRHNGFVVCSWDTMRERQEDLEKYGFRLMIADEAHYAKDPRSARSKALASLAEQIPHVVLLTGTPFKNVVAELWTLLSIVNPKAWGKQGEFKRKFTVIKEVRAPNGMVIEVEEDLNQENLPELKKRLQCTMIRRLKSSVLKFLPKKVMYRQDVEITPAQRAVYKEAEDRFESWLAEETARRIREALEAEGIDPKTVTAQIVEGVRSRVESAMKAEIIVRMGELRQLVGRFKAPQAAKMVASAGEPVLLWCHHDEVVKSLAKACKAAGLRYAIIAGDTPSKDRSQIADAFQEGDLDVLICTMAAREGLTLTRSATAIFVERYWSPADERQAEDRIYRIGQNKEVSIIRLHVPNSIDDRMEEINRAKQGKVDDVLGDDQFESRMRRENSVLIARHYQRKSLERRGRRR